MKKWCKFHVSSRCCGQLRDRRLCTFSSIGHITRKKKYRTHAQNTNIRYSFPFALLCMHILCARNDQAPLPSFSTKPQLRWSSIIPFLNKATNSLKYPSLLLHACTHEPLASILSPTKAPLALHMSHNFSSEFSIYPMYHATSKPPKHFPSSMWRSPFN